MSEPQRWYVHGPERVRRFGRGYGRLYGYGYGYGLRGPDMLQTVQLCGIAIVGLAAITAITEPQLPELPQVLNHNYPLRYGYG